MMLLETLRIDFSLNRGHEMIIDRETGITRDQLEEVEIHMLQGQRVPKLLGVEWIDIDGFVTFRYSLAGRRMLSHKLQSQQLTMNDFYTLLLAIVEALDDCQHYMLRTSGFMLQEQYIFVGEDWDDIGLVYVPLRREAPESSAEEAVMTMAVRWIGYISQPDGAGIQQVFRHLRGEHGSWHDLRQKLLTLMNSTYIQGAQGASPSTPAFSGESRAKSSASPVNNWQSNHWHSEFGGRGLAARKEQMSGQIDQNVQSAPSSVLPFRKRSAESIALASKEDAEKQPVNHLKEDELPIVPFEGDNPDGGQSRKQWLLGAGLILAIALIWRYLYLSSPTRTSLLISLGLTVLAVTGLLVYLRRERPDDDSQEDDWRNGNAWAAEEDGFVPDSTIFNQGKAVPVFERQPQTIKQTGSEQSLTEQKAAHFQTNNPSVSSGFSPIVSLRHQSETVNRQERVHASEPPQDLTVLLGDGSNNRNQGGQLLPWLEREAEGKVERLSIQTDRFVVGRSAEGAHYVDSSSGISRAHLELLCAAECWSAKDIGSRNGSTLNGQTMIPYKAYVLENGDILQLAGEKGPKYTFRAG